MYYENRVGPRIDPCGTPQEIDAGLYTVSHKSEYSTPLTCQQKCYYNFSRDNTAQMKLIILEDIF